MLKIIAFDVFGTLVDFVGVSRDDVRDYGRQIKQTPWKPLDLSPYWDKLSAFPDVKAGIELLRAKFTVVTLSNAPLGLQIRLLKHNSVTVDGIIPLELFQVYKPQPLAYKSLCNTLKCVPAQVCMVTANKDFGDIEAAGALGMQTRLIRHPDATLKTVLELAEDLQKES